MKFTTCEESDATSQVLAENTMHYHSSLVLISRPTLSNSPNLYPVQYTAYNAMQKRVYQMKIHDIEYLSIYLIDHVRLLVNRYCVT